MAQVHASRQCYKISIGGPLAVRLLFSVFREVSSPNHPHSCLGSLMLHGQHGCYDNEILSI